MKYKTFHIACLSLLSIVLFLLPISSCTGKTMKVGVLAKRGKARAIKQWSAHMTYLGTKTGQHFVLVPLAFDEIFSSVALRKIDFIITNPGFFVVLKKKFGVRPIASLLNYRQGKPLNKFSGVIFTRAGSRIRSCRDLRNTTFMCVKMTSFGGAQMAFKYLIDKGINPFEDLKALREGGTHDAVVYAVRNGVVDAGTVRSDTLERMAAEGKIKMSEFKIINPAKDSFPFVHTTALYPEWPFGVLSHTDPRVIQKVKKALLSMKPTEPAARAAKIAGWSEPLDYRIVARCLQKVKNAP